MLDLWAKEAFWPDGGARGKLMESLFVSSGEHECAQDFSWKSALKSSRADSVSWGRYQYLANKTLASIYFLT